MRALVVLMLLVGLGLVSGCATMTQTPEQRAATYGRVIHYDMLGLAEDFDYVMMFDRPTRLTEWVVR